MEEPNIEELLNTVKKLTGQLRSMEGVMSQFPSDQRQNVPTQFDITSLIEAEALVQRIEKSQKRKDMDMETESEDEYLMESDLMDEVIDPQFDLQDTIDPKRISSKGYQITDDLYIPNNIFDHLMSHQPGGISFILSNLLLDRGCILADFMGLGKSIQSLIALFLYKQQFPDSSFLVLCPMNVAKHWEKEVAKVNTWIDKKDHMVVMNLASQKTLRSRIDYLQLWKTKSCILICTYDMFKIMNSDVEASELLTNPGPDIVLLDEGHKLRHHDTQIYKSLIEIHTKRRIILTGYPFQNNLIEYYTMINFVRPDHLGDLSSFRKLFERPISQGKDSVSTTQKKQIARRRAWLLHNRLLEVILRRDSSLLKKILPEKKECILIVTMTPFQHKLYEKFMTQIHTVGTRTLLFWVYDCITMLVNHPDIFYKYVGTIDKHFEISPDPDTQALREHFSSILKVLFEKEYQVGTEVSSKFEFTKSIITESVQKKDKLVIFSKSILALNFLEEYVKKEKIKSLRFDGSTDSDSREEMIERFNSDKSGVSVFLISTLAGGEGINLYAANRIILFDVNWNPSHDAEATCRVFRYGQKKNVWIYRLICHDTMEEVIFRRQLKKEMIGRWVIDDTSSALTNDDSDNKQLFLIPTSKLFDDETFSAQIKDVKDSVTLEVLKKNKKYIHELHFQDELLREDESFSLTEEEKKRAYTEEEWDTVYGRPVRVRKEQKGDTTSKQLDDHMKRVSKNTSPMIAKKGIISLEESTEEDDEEFFEEFQPQKKMRTEEMILEQKEKLVALRVNTSFGKTLALEVSPLSGSVNGSPGIDQKATQHKKLEEERKKLIGNQLKISSGSTDFRRQVREQMNEFKKRCDAFLQNK